MHNLESLPFTSSDTIDILDDDIELPIENPVMENSQKGNVFAVVKKLEITEEMMKLCPFVESVLLTNNFWNHFWRSYKEKTRLMKPMSWERKPQKIFPPGDTIPNTNRGIWSQCNIHVIWVKTKPPYNNPLLCKNFIISTSLWNYLFYETICFLSSLVRVKYSTNKDLTGILQEKHFWMIQRHLLKVALYWSYIFQCNL